MKKLFTLVLLAAASMASGQWSNTTNQFFDSLHMPVSTATLVQKNPLVVKSYPDSGYFVIWEDERNSATTKTDIYAQKYDKAGNRKWAVNGVPVVNGPNAQRYAFSSNQDYRNRSFAATDSAGGFYIGYIDDSVTNYSWERIAIQHMKSDGTGVFGGPGYIVAQTPPGQSHTFSAPFLIADGNKGCFISYSRNATGENFIYVFSYKDENGTMKHYGGGRVNENAIQRSRLSYCGVQNYLDYPGISVQDYNIWPDGQGGCNVVMALNGNGGGQGRMLGFNRIWRAKKTSLVRTYARNSTGAACPRITAYKTGDVYLLYRFAKDEITTFCAKGDGTEAYSVTSERLLSNGYQLLDIGGYDYSFPKGVTVATPGNINVDLIAVTRRTYSNNTVSDFTVQGYAYRIERFDSIPYQRATYSNPDFGYNPIAPAKLNKLNFLRDTLLASGNYYPDFSLAGGGQHLFSASLMSTSGDRLVRLQHLSVERMTADSFAVKYKTTTKYGEVIGKELSTGFSGSNISYDFPLVSVNNAGNGFFYINDYNRSARVSPIINGAELAWGAMGRIIGTAVHQGSYYNLLQPYTALDPVNGTALIAWKDNRSVPGNTGENIFMRHLDNLNEPNSLPPYKPVQLIPNPYGATAANPIVLLGSSKRYSTIEFSGLYSNTSTTPVAELLDNYNLGRVQVNLFQNSGVIRKYNNQAYLDRNFTITSENHPSGANLNLRLFFTTTEFDALKAADNTITTPGDLVVIKQPNNTLTTPSAYTPVSGEELLSPMAWSAVPGGYYLEIGVTGFSNFFIMKTSTATLCKGSNTTISSNIIGATYQWQVNTGSGFVNINDNANYAGTKTVNLQIKGAPTSWYGYTYRSLVGASTSNVFTLTFSTTWTGAVSTAWEDPANWSCGGVPDANTDVIINAGTVLLNSNTSVRSLRTNPFVSLTVNPARKLTIAH